MLTEIGIKHDLIILNIHRSQFFEETGRNSEEITANQAENFVNIAERSSHNFSLVTKLLIVVVNLGHGKYTRVVEFREARLTFFSHMPIINTANEGRYECHSGFRTSDGLIRDRS